MLWLPIFLTMKFYNGIIGHFPVIPLKNCPFITHFTYNTVHPYGSQIVHGKKGTFFLLQS